MLSVLDQDVYWVTRKESIPLLPKGTGALREVIDIECADRALQNISFDLVLCLDDDLEAARLASRVNKKNLIGSFLKSSEEVKYTPSAVQWFDMGFISRFGRERANELKLKNRRTYQDIIFAMLGKKFNGEEYLLNHRNNNNRNKKEKLSVGIESRVGSRWPTKKWNKYEELGKFLCREGFEVKFFRQRDKVGQYIEDIGECDLIVTGDTLALHIGLALEINTVANFTCTSPTEIYDYGRMIKIVSPLLENVFYGREYIQEAADAVSLDRVYRAVNILLSGKICQRPV